MPKYSQAYVYGDDSTVKEVSPKAILQHLKDAARQPTVLTRIALKELGKINSIEELLCSPNAGIAGKR